jgi:hypothetical protein
LTAPRRRWAAVRALGRSATTIWRGAARGGCAAAGGGAGIRGSAAAGGAAAGAGAAGWGEAAELAGVFLGRGAEHFGAESFLGRVELRARQPVIAVPVGPQDDVQSRRQNGWTSAHVGRGLEWKGRLTFPVSLQSHNGRLVQCIARYDLSGWMSTRIRS